MQLSWPEVAGSIDTRRLSWRQALTSFETFYMASRNLAARTRVEYRADLRQLADFLTQRGINNPAEVALAHLQAFLAWLDSKGYAGVTRRRKTASIKAFFGFLTNAGVCAHNPARRLIPPERAYSEPRYLTTQEYRALLAACAHHPRDAAIIELLLQTGIRLAEVARLTLNDVELPKRINQDPENTGNLFIRGKGKRSRTLPLNHKACRALKAWLDVRPDIPDPALFVTRFREPLLARGVQRLVAKHLKAAGIDHASVHTLRHTFGTIHVAKGTDLRTVQAMMGHADLKATAIYVALAKQYMKRALQENAL